MNEDKKITHLKPDLIFNSRKFWDLGGSYMRMDRELYNSFEEEMAKITWEVDETMHYNSSPAGIRIHNKLPKELTNKEMLDILNRHIISSFSPELLKCVERLLLSEQTAELQQLYDFKIVFTDLWNGSEGCPWHWDGTDSGDALILAYFSDHAKWKPELGGHLEIGRNLGTENIYLSNIGDVESIGFIPPQKQSWVIVNNKNPHLVHCSHKLHQHDERRMTLTMGLEFVIKQENRPSRVIWPI